MLAVIRWRSSLPLWCTSRCVIGIVPAKEIVRIFELGMDQGNLTIEVRVMIIRFKFNIVSCVINGLGQVRDAVKTKSI